MMMQFSSQEEFEQVYLRNLVIPVHTLLPIEPEDYPRLMKPQRSTMEQITDRITGLKFVVWKGTTSIEYVQFEGKKLHYTYKISLEETNDLSNRGVFLNF